MWPLRNADSTSLGWREVDATLDLTAILVSYNTRDLTLRALAALHDELEAAPGLTWEVHVVDNASADGSANAVRTTCPWATVHDAGGNLGFGRANNVALRQARGRWLLLLNTDAFLQPKALASLLAAGRDRADVGVIAPRLLNEDGSLQRSCWRFPSPLRSWLDALAVPSWPGLRSLAWVDDYRGWAHDEERSVDFAIGACLLVRRTAVEEVGLFDEAIFLYGEETDWLRRLASASWRVWFTPTAEVIHLGGASGASPASGAVRMWFFDGQDYVMRKHFGFAGLATARLGVLLNNVLRWPVRVWRARRGDPAALDNARLSRWLICRQLRGLCGRLQVAAQFSEGRA